MINVEAVKRVVDFYPPMGRLARKARDTWVEISSKTENRIAATTKVVDRMNLRHRRFEKAFNTGVWSSTGESMSGSGSSLKATEKLRAVLPGVLQRLGVKTLLDVPCGDWNWMSRLELPIDRYIGGDIVTPLIHQNQKKFSDPRRTFQIIDLCVDDLPTADLLLCRDALIHFSNFDISRAIANVKRAEIAYIATTTFTATEVNTDQITGIPWRHLNLEAAPFSFPEPLIRIVDNFSRHDQIIAIWRVADLPKVPTES